MYEKDHQGVKRKIPETVFYNSESYTGYEILPVVCTVVQQTTSVCICPSGSLKKATAAVHC